jgi:hypothetical protein
MYILSLVDAYAPDREAGIPQVIFEGIFGVCPSCDAHMTRRVAKYHSCQGDSGLDDFDWDVEL